jgi:hypothetical protein
MISKNNKFVAYYLMRVVVVIFSSESVSRLFLVLGRFYTKFVDLMVGLNLEYGMAWFFDSTVARFIKQIERTILMAILMFLVGCSSSSSESVDEALKHIAKDLDLSALTADHDKTGGKITFDATKVNCPQGSNVGQYDWQLTEKPSNSTSSLSDSSSPQPKLLLDVDGEYKAEVSVSCKPVFSPGVAPGSNVSPTITKVITREFTVEASANVSQAKAVAIAGLEQTAKVGIATTLDGRKSFDNDLNPLTYSWTFVSAPTGSTASLDDDTSAIPKFTPDVAGTYELQLIVHDGNTDSAPDTTKVFATLPSVNGQPTANAGIDQVDVLGHAITLHGLGSHDPDADALSYEWLLNHEPSGSHLAAVASSFDATKAEPSFTPQVEGIYIFKLRVNDGTLKSTWDFVTVKVNAAQHSSSPLNDLVSMGLDSTDAHHLLANHSADATAIAAISDRIFSGVQITDDMFVPPTDSGAAGFQDTQMTTWEARHIKRFKKIFGRIAFVVNTTKFKDAFDAQVSLLDSSYQGSNNLVLPANIAAFSSDLSATITFPGSFSVYKLAINSVVEDAFNNGGKFKFYISERTSGVAYGGRALKLKIERYGMAGDASPDGKTKPWHINQAAALMFHELMHSVGYAHDPSNAQTTLKPNNIPYFVQIIAGYQETDILNKYCGGAVATCTQSIQWGYPNAIYTHYFGDT